MWVEIPTVDGINLLNNNNHYFSPGTKPEVINIFAFLKNILDTKNLRVILLGDFNISVLTGRASHFCPTVIIILNSRGMLYTPPHIFLAFGSALKLLPALPRLT